MLDADDKEHCWWSPTRPVRPRPATRGCTSSAVTSATATATRTRS